MQSCSCLLQAKLAAADAAAAQGAASADELATLQQRIAKLEALKAGLNEALQAGQAEIAALQVGGGSAVLQPPWPRWAVGGPSATDSPAGSPATRSAFLHVCLASLEPASLDPASSY